MLGVEEWCGKQNKGSPWARMGPTMAITSAASKSKGGSEQSPIMDGASSPPLAANHMSLRAVDVSKGVLSSCTGWKRDAAGWMNENEPSSSSFLSQNVQKLLFCSARARKGVRWKEAAPRRVRLAPFCPESDLKSGKIPPIKAWGPLTKPGVVASSVSDRRCCVLRQVNENACTKRPSKSTPHRRCRHRFTISAPAIKWEVT